LLFRTATAFVLATTLAACVSSPDLGVKPRLRAASTIAAERSFATAARSDWPADGWWNDYGDPQLARLITEGLDGSPDLVAAAARFRMAQGAAQSTGAALLPSLDAEGRASFEKQSYNMGFPAQFVPKGWKDGGQGDLNLSFDLDLWGRNRAALAAATSEADAARIEQDQARLMLTTGIASAYVDLARLYAERDVLAAAVDLRIATQRLVSGRVRTGLDTRAELKQADAAVSQARADLTGADESIAMARNQLAALIGAGPDRGLDITRPSLTNLHPAGLPAQVTTDLIGRRPDITAARARVEAAASRIRVARADFYPAISLEALVGVQSLGLGNLAKSGSTFGKVGPAISLPIFHGGALKGQYRSARATYDEAVANYNGTVLTAYRQVADTVTAQRALAEQLMQSRLALADSEEAYAIATKRYEGGLSTYLDVLTAGERVLQVRRSVANLNARAIAIDVALVRALGGGFTAGANPKDHSHG